MQLSRNHFFAVFLVTLFVLAEGRNGAAQLPRAPQQQAASQSGNSSVKIDGPTVTGTVLDTNDDLVQGATVVLDGTTPDDHREIASDDNGQFTFTGLKAGIPYHVQVIAGGFSSWQSEAVVLTQNDYKVLTGITLRVEPKDTSVTVYASTDAIATEQVKLEEQQRVFGFIPNFYVVYDSKNVVPLTTKLKFKLALRVSVDPISIGGVAMMAGIDQAANTPDYVQGAKGYGQRFGTVAADSFDDILIGGAILPSLLHQDPRYFYQGTGTKKSRIMHAVSSPFICKGDNGRWQPNYSSVGGDLASSAISDTFYPQSNRGAGLVFGNFGVSTAERVLSAVAQEFVLPHFTPSARERR